MRGDCMAPLLADGGRVRVAAARFYLPGDVVVFRAADGRLVAHRLLGYRLHAGALALVTRGDACPVHDAPVPLAAVLGRVEAVRPTLAARAAALRRFLGLAGSRARRPGDELRRAVPPLPRPLPRRARAASPGGTAPSLLDVAGGPYLFSGLAPAQEEAAAPALRRASAGPADRGDSGGRSPSRVFRAPAADFLDRRHPRLGVRPRPRPRRRRSLRRRRAAPDGAPRLAAPSSPAPPLDLRGGGGGVGARCARTACGCSSPTACWPRGGADAAQRRGDRAGGDRPSSSSAPRAPARPPPRGSAWRPGADVLSDDLNAVRFPERRGRPGWRAVPFTGDLGDRREGPGVRAAPPPPPRPVRLARGTRPRACARCRRRRPSPPCSPPRRYVNRDPWRRGGAARRARAAGARGARLRADVLPGRRPLVYTQSIPPV